jgi:hypothetical protein
MNAKNPEVDSAIPAEPADQEAQIAALEQHVAQAQVELEEYQRLLKELPGIYEGKFRQQLRAVIQEIRELLDERKGLQKQVAHALAQPPLLPAPVVKTWADVRLPRFNPSSLTVLAFAALPGRRWLWAGAAGLLLLGFIAAGSRRLAQQSSPTGGAKGPVMPQRQQAPGALVPLHLEARGGKSWVLVEDLQGRQVFEVILQPGVRHRLSLGSGLRLRSGRPDLLFVAVGDQVPRPLGGLSDLQWVVVRP